MKNLKVAFFWFCGVILAFVFTALPILLVLVAKVYGIQPETLSGFIGTWFFGSLTVALLPALMIALGVADDGLVRFFDESGQQMILYDNFIAWAAWLIIGLLSLLFAFAFKEELIDSPDGEDDSPPKSLYRRVWGWMKSFSLAVLIMVLPNKDGEVPD